MRYFVIGGRGWIGSRVCRLLIDAGHRVVVLDPKESRGSSDGAESVIGSVANPADVAAVLSDGAVDGIALMPFYRGPNVADEHEIMAAATWRVFDAAARAGIRRVVFASSIRVHGPQRYHGELALNEDSVCMPVDRYGLYKRLGELTANSYNHRHGAEIAALRIPAVYGPGAREGAAGVSMIPYQAAQGARVVVPYHAESRMCLAHVDDVAAAIAAVLTGARSPATVYECGGVTVSYRDMAQTVRQLIPDAQIDFASTGNGAEQSFSYLVDNSRLREHYGITHRSLLDGYRSVVEWVSAEIRR